MLCGGFPDMSPGAKREGEKQASKTSGDSAKGCRTVHPFHAMWGFGGIIYPHYLTHF